MERIRNMSLKKSFFTITIFFLLIGVILGAASFIGCIALRDSFFASGQFSIDFDSTPPADTTIQYSALNEDWRGQALSILQIVSPIFFVTVSLLLADIVFYRIKLKKPLAVLQRGAERIQRQDLDFSIEKCADDELGTLCAAFETMRVELLKNNRELWRQMEERKRLNAAFSHDLRNPVTVLKGSAKILQKGVEQGTLTSESADTVSLISQYAGRIETYIEAMTSAQKLEELKCCPQPVICSALANELESSLSILSADTGKEMQFICHGDGGQIWVDKYIIQNTAENLISNALRYAQATVSVELTYEQDRMILRVSDDGFGFSPAILHKGAAPFLRDDNTAQQEHFGMGLYVCRLLCEKHGGSLTLENGPCGATVTAIFGFLKS